jgi:hypothetical protein
VNHEPTRWSRTVRSVTPQVEHPSEPVSASPEQLHLVSQGYPVRIRRAFVAGGVALALALGGSVAASLTSSSTGPESAPGDAVVTGQASVDG